MMTAAHSEQRRAIRWQLFAVLCSLFALRCLCFASGEPDAWTLSGVGARPLGMGGAFVGLADDIEAIYFNSAGLANLETWTASAMAQPPSLETSRGFISMGKNWAWEPLPGAAAFGWHRLASRRIEITSRDERVLGEDDLANDLLLVGAGVRPLKNWAFGAAVKYHRFSFHGFSESGIGADVGAQGIYGGFRFGAVLSDVGGTMLSGDSIVSGGGTVKDKIPARLRLGVASKTKAPFRWPITLNAALDGYVKLQGPDETRIHTGGEIWGFKDRAALRLGFQQFNGPTFGAGARIGRIQMDYAFLLSLNLTDEHRLGTTLRF